MIDRAGLPATGPTPGHTPAVTPSAGSAASSLQAIRDWAIATGRLRAASSIPADNDFRTALGKLRRRELTAVPFVPSRCSSHDGDLDDYQRDAVTRALRASDFLLIEGRPGTGKRRLVVELIGQLMMAGRRVLVLQPDGRPALPLPAACGSNFVIVNGSPAQEAEVRQRHHRLLIDRADMAVATLTRECDELEGTKPGILKIGQLAGAAETHRLQCDEREARRQATLLRSTDELQEAERLAAERIAILTAERAVLAVSIRDCDAELRQAREARNTYLPMEEAARSTRFWSSLFWKARLSRSLPEEIEQANKCIAAAETNRAGFVERSEQIARELPDCEQGCRLRRTELENNAEFETASPSIADRIAELHQAIRDLLPTGLIADDATPAAAVSYCDNWLVSVIELRDELSNLIRWHEALQSPAAAIREPLGAGCDLIVASPRLLARQPEWLRVPFDVLIVLDAQTCVEADLLPVAQAARHWIMLGEPAPPTNPARFPVRVSPQRQSHPRPALFHELWQLSRFDAWTSETDRRVYRLHPVAPADRAKLETESVADRPDIELRILPGDDEPILAEVAFPAEMTSAEARQFLFRELGEIPCRTSLRSGHWDESNEGVRFRLNSSDSTELPPCLLPLGDGIDLLMHDPAGGHQRDEFAIQFPAGYAIESAKAWLIGHLARHDDGRTCRLTHNYRQGPSLAAWLQMASGHTAPAVVPAAIQFEAVPRRAPSAPRRGGAGYEIDLADPQQRDLVPDELVGRLPGHGYINLPEAQSIAELVRQPDLKNCIVTSAYAAQVEVLRHYIPGGVGVRPLNDVLADECDLLIISLTRSHVSRAVTYSVRPDDIPRLCGRVRSRIIFVGDPGTLNLRAQWEGAIDQFDELAGESERRWVSALLMQLPLKPVPTSRTPAGVRA